MKKVTALFIVVLMLGFSGCAKKTPTREKNNYVVSTTKVPQLKPIILTAEALKEEDGQQFGDFQILVYGNSVKELTDKQKMEPYVIQAKAAGAKIFACSIALERNGVAPEELHEYIKVVDHAFTHLLQLQKNKNYYSIEL
jgi:intracellular sulfur oxidation DsrE/DsrF family protein